MKIYDLYGKDIVVTDLKLAIAQTNVYRGYEYENPDEAQGKAVQERKRYWTDMHSKLLQLQQRINSLKNQKR